MRTHASADVTSPFAFVDPYSDSMWNWPALLRVIPILTDAINRVDEDHLRAQLSELLRVVRAAEEIDGYVYLESD